MITEPGQSTALTEADWQHLANSKYGVYVLVEGDQVIDRGPYLKVSGEFALAVAAGKSVRFESHTDYVTAKTVRYALEAE